VSPLLRTARDAARNAGRIILRAMDRLDTLEVETKGPNNYVTRIDRQAEELIIRSLHDAYPQHGILGEETGLQAAAPGVDYLWIIDPLDGTTNFVRGLPHFSVSIACRHQGRVEHAVVLDPVRGEEFTASHGEGAHLNNRRLRIANRAMTDTMLIACGFPYHGRNIRRVERYLNCLRELASISGGVRRGGSAALDIAYVAAGRLDGFWEAGLKPWDVAAASLLVKEAGGLVSDFQGQSGYLESGDLICGSPACFRNLREVVGRAFTGDQHEHESRGKLTRNR